MKKQHLIYNGENLIGRIYADGYQDLQEKLYSIFGDSVFEYEVIEDASWNDAPVLS
jgi:hypothetical protein